MVIGLPTLSFVLLLTPTGSLPSPRWRWWARVTGAAPVTVLVAVGVASGSLDPQYQAVGGPFDFRGLGGTLLIVNQLALSVTTLAVVGGAGRGPRRPGRPGADLLAVASADGARAGTAFASPTLILAGRQDATAGYAGSWRLLAHYPRATFAVLDRAGHGLLHEQVGLAGALLAEWLDRVREHRAAATND